MLTMAPAPASTQGKRPASPTTFANLVSEYYEQKKPYNEMFASYLQSQSSNEPAENQDESGRNPWHGLKRSEVRKLFGGVGMPPEDEDAELIAERKEERAQKAAEKKCTTDPTHILQYLRIELSRPGLDPRAATRDLSTYYYYLHQILVYFFFFCITKYICIEISSITHNHNKNKVRKYYEYHFYRPIL